MIPSCPVELLQNDRELEWLLGVYDELEPRHIIEIGSMYGGTLWYWMKHTSPGGVFVSIDLLVPEDDARRAFQIDGHRVIWKKWAEEMGHTVHVIEADSGSIGTRDLVKGIMPSVDFLFIDGDHTEQSARQDWENYSPLVRPGGLVAFHDIAARGPIFGVHKVWEGLKGKYLSGEFILGRDEWGTGVLQIPE